MRIVFLRQKFAHLNMKYVVQYMQNMYKINVRKIHVKFVQDSQIKFILLLFSQSCVECYNKIVKVRIK